MTKWSGPSRWACRSRSCAATTPASKSGLKYTGAALDAMAAVASAHKERCLMRFEAVLEQYKA